MILRDNLRMSFAASKDNNRLIEINNSPVRILGDGFKELLSPRSNVSVSKKNSIKLILLIKLSKDLRIFLERNINLLKEFNWKSFRSI